MRQAIGYIRVSTAKQGRSGLGLEAQQDVLRRFAEAEGFAFAETFTEVESAKHGETTAPSWPRHWNGHGRPRHRSSWPSSTG